MSIIENQKWLKGFATSELLENILPFWRTKAIDNEAGGFYGEISNNLTIQKDAQKGLILNARILWTFSAAYQYTKDKKELEIAHRAYNYLCDKFHDKEYGGYYWTLNADGSPADTKKQIYAQAFTMYGMSEYYKITKDLDALNRCIDLYRLIEEKSFDKEKNGYFEAYTREWNEIEDMRLSVKDMNEKKTMNTHLHIVEAYANLYLVWKDSILAKSLKNLVVLFLEKIISKEDNHLNLFFDENWNSKSTAISYGHDIEAGWLIHESALIHGEKELIHRVEGKLALITDAALEGLSTQGALYHEGDRAGKHTDYEIEWWPQAEAIVGLINTFQLTGKEKYLETAVKIGEFIVAHITDHENGEWFYRVNSNGEPIPSYAKAGLWKCPYHNGRACLEIIKRIESLT